MNWLKSILVSMVLALIVVPGISLSHGDASEILPSSRAASEDSCVAPVEDMRRNHMEHLLHKRVETMRRGIRTPDFSINECVSCHAAKDDAGHYVPVVEEGQFCQSCHERVAKKIDCFQCHRTTPES